MNNKRNNIRNLLFKELTSLPVYNVTANKKEISIRCPFCGDSHKHSNSTHLYVCIEPEEDQPFFYYCFRCQSKGYVTEDFFHRIHVTDIDLISNIEKDLATVKKNTKHKRKYMFSSKKNLNIPIAESTKTNKVKLNYINKRLGTKLTFEDLVKYKINLDLYELLDFNNVQQMTCKENLQDYLAEIFLGFVSYDNNYVILRNISKKHLTDIRYYNYNIFNVYENTKKFYIIPNEVDLLSERITIILSEGIFDILGVYFNIENQDNKNKVYGAVCGTGYNNVIDTIIRMGFLDIDLKIYADNDQDNNLYLSIKRKFDNFINHMEVYTNSSNKDFGDWSKEVTIRKQVLK